MSLKKNIINYFQKKNKRCFEFLKKNGLIVLWLCINYFVYIFFVLIRFYFLFIFIKILLFFIYFNIIKILCIIFLFSFIFIFLDIFISFFIFIFEKLEDIYIFCLKILINIYIVILKFLKNIYNNINSLCKILFKFLYKYFIFILFFSFYFSVNIDFSDLNDIVYVSGEFLSDSKEILLKKVEFFNGLAYIHNSFEYLKRVSDIYEFSREIKNLLINLYKFIYFLFENIHFNFNKDIFIRYFSFIIIIVIVFILFFFIIILFLKRFFNNFYKKIIIIFFEFKELLISGFRSFFFVFIYSFVVTLFISTSSIFLTIENIDNFFSIFKLFRNIYIIYFFLRIIFFVIWVILLI
jgi:hypothetical protein